MTKEKTVNDLLVSEIKDLYSAEKQLVRALPNMANGAHHPALKEAFKDHLKETETQVQRLEDIADILDMAPGGKKCVGMEGIVEEGTEARKEEGNPTILDLGIIAAALRVEHYEMAGYTITIGLAEKLGEDEVVDLLNESLAEEMASHDMLRDIARDLTRDAPVV